MDNNESDPLLAEMADARERSLADDMRQLAEDAKALAEAELAYQKTRAAFAGKGLKGIAILGVLAVALALFALMALALGLVLALTPMLTAWGATGAVFAGFLLAALACGLSASSRWKHMAAVLSDREPDA